MTYIGSFGIAAMKRFIREHRREYEHLLERKEAEAGA